MAAGLLDIPNLFLEKLELILFFALDISKGCQLTLHVLDLDHLLERSLRQLIVHVSRDNLPPAGQFLIDLLFLEVFSLLSQFRLHVHKLGLVANGHRHEVLNLILIVGRAHLQTPLVGLRIEGLVD